MRLHGFKIGEHVLIHNGGTLSRGKVLGTVGRQQLSILYDGLKAATYVPASMVLHDTPAAKRWLAVELPADGHKPTWEERGPALQALHADNPHLQPNIAKEPLR